MHALNAAVQAVVQLQHVDIVHQLRFNGKPAKHFQKVGLALTT
jgi:hypothetical protein